MSRGWGTFGGGSRSIDGTRWHDLWSLGGVTGIMGMKGARRIYGI